MTWVQDPLMALWYTCVTSPANKCIFFKKKIKSLYFILLSTECLYICVWELCIHLRLVFLACVSTCRSLLNSEGKRFSWLAKLKYWRWVSSANLALTAHQILAVCATDPPWPCRWVYQAGCQSVRIMMDTPALLLCLCVFACGWNLLGHCKAVCSSAFYTPVNLLNRMSIFRENKHILLNNFLPSVWPSFPSVHNRTRSQGRLCIPPVS